MHAIERLRTLIGLFGNSGGVLRNLSLLGTMIAEHPDLCVICSNETEAREIRARAGSEQGPSTAARIRHLGELDGLEDRTPPMELVFTPFAVQALIGNPGAAPTDGYGWSLRKQREADAKAERRQRAGVIQIPDGQQPPHVPPDSWLFPDFPSYRASIFADFVTSENIRGSRWRRGEWVRVPPKRGEIRLCERCTGSGREPNGPLEPVSGPESCAICDGARFVRIHDHGWAPFPRQEDADGS